MSEPIVETAPPTGAVTMVMIMALSLSLSGSAPHHLVGGFAIPGLRPCNCADVRSPSLACSRKGNRKFGYCA